MQGVFEYIYPFKRKDKIIGFISVTGYQAPNHTVSHIFKKYNGKTVKEYLNTIRIKDAQTLLTNTNLNMMQIASSTGFTDSNYFAVVFKKHTGISPTEYRKNTNNL